MTSLTVTEQRRAPRGAVWRTIAYQLNRGPDIARYIARHRYAWPGGYPLAAVTDDGALLCADCCRREYPRIRASDPGDGWHVVGYSIEDDAPSECDHCGAPIRE